MQKPLAVALLIWAGACGGGHKPRVKAPASTVPVGSCADPARDGIVSPEPKLHRADRDLDGDREPEVVVADDNLCTREHNCYWNVYARRRPAGPGGSDCWRYLGTVEASAIESLRLRGEEGFHDLRGWWMLTGGGRVLLQHYRYRRGAYQLVEAMVCRQEGDDRLLCASDDRESP